MKKAAKSTSLLLALYTGVQSLRSHHTFLRMRRACRNAQWYWRIPGSLATSRCTAQVSALAPGALSTTLLHTLSRMWDCELGTPAAPLYATCISCQIASLLEELLKAFFASNLVEG